MNRDPIHHQLHVATKLPAVVLAGWASLWIDGLLAWQRVYEAQIEMLSRQAELVRSRNWIAKGADWADHYGKRARDVNVERV
ncbi:MAG TPA: hypothetical protein VGG27_11720 [Magnetospirillaceae bacterium]|jgi:hypothetical protein